MRLLILAALILFSVSCGKNTEPASGGFSEKPQGTFVGVQDLPVTDTSRFGIGCQTAGSIQDKAQIDSRLRVGLSSSMSIQYTSTTAGTQSMVWTGNITAITSSSVSTQYQISKAENIPGIQSGFSANVTCTLDAEAHYNCVSNPAAPPIGLSNECYVKDVTGSTKQSQSLGRYTMASGRTVTAYRITYSSSGDIICKGTNMGSGRMDEVTVVSNEIPSADSPHFCGGVMVFESVVLTKNEGGVIYGAVIERTGLN